MGIERLVAHKKNVIKRRATLLFSDESGFLLLPLVRRTLAPRGQTPILRHRARQRDKVSAAAALTLSPVQGHVSLYFQTYPNRYINNEAYAQFLHGLLRKIPHPLVVVHDGGSMHKGDPLRELCGAFPRLELNPLPPYAPDYNPVEHLWNFEKDKELANFVPNDVRSLDSTVSGCLQKVSHDQNRLRSFFAATPLPWDGLAINI
jgi:hypothetical protein